MSFVIHLAKLVGVLQTGSGSHLPGMDCKVKNQSESMHSPDPNVHVHISHVNGSF